MNHASASAPLEHLTGIPGWELDTDRRHIGRGFIFWFRAKSHDDACGGPERRYLSIILIENGSVEISAFLADDFGGNIGRGPGEFWSAKYDAANLKDGLVADDGNSPINPEPAVMEAPELGASN